MRPESKHSRNVIERTREAEAVNQIPSAPHSHPEVSFPQGERHFESPIFTQHDPENEIAASDHRNGLTENADAATDRADDLASVHEQHARQIEAIGRERNELAERLAAVARELAQARKEHAEELEHTRLDRDEIIKAKEHLGLQLAHVREHHRGQNESFAADRDSLTAERDQLTAQLAEWRARHQAETHALSRDHDDLSTTLAQEREQHHQELVALTAQHDQRTRERDDLSAELDRTREQRRKELEAVTAERDSLQDEQKTTATVGALQLEKHQSELAALASQHDRVTQERYRISSEFSTFRESHYTAIDSLTRERDQFRVAQAELRAHLAVVKDAHWQESEESRREHTAVIKEADEIHELLETDRLAWRKQVELFTAERETLTRERDEALAELIRERQSEGQQVGLRNQECGNLLEQRAEMLGQIEELRAAEQRQHDLFHAERAVLCEERDHAAEKLARCMEALGEDRMTMLQQKNAAESRLAAAKQEHSEKIAAFEEARVEVAGERDSARRELAVFLDAQAREQTLFGAVATRKHELDSTTVREGLGMKCAAKDAALGREVELRMIHGGGTSDERRAELVEEARHLARLQHPNIPPIYEAGFDENGQVFYTTKAVSGMSLREVLNELERGKTSSLLHFSLRRLLSVFHRVCDALAYAHAREIAHADLKPEHIVLGEFGEVYVTGWRLPRIAITEGEAIPEFHPRDDITALGRILYEMTSLIQPPGADEERGDAALQGMTGAARAWAGDKDVNALAAIAKRALNPKVAGRFYSVRELQKQVDAFKDSFDDPTRLTIETILRQWIGCHRTALIVSAIALVLAITAGLWLIAHQRAGTSGASPTFHAADRLELTRPAPPPK